MPQDLLRAFKQFYLSANETGGEAAPHFPAILAGLDRAPSQSRGPQPRSWPVVEQHLDEALALGRGQGHDGLIDAISANRQDLVWNSSKATYGDDPAYREFLDNYAFTVLVGPAKFGLESLFYDDRMVCGLTIQAPGIHYPAHAHEAVEIYAVAGGTARWLRGEEGWRRRPPGSVILHESKMAHAMETDREPLLALFAWVSDLDGRPYMVVD